VSGVLHKLEIGDEIMADKAFDIKDLLAPLGVRLNIPTLKTQFLCENVMKTKKIAKLRIHVERAIRRFKRISNFNVGFTQ